MKILVTGALGFVGNNICRYLTIKGEDYIMAVDIGDPNHGFYNSYIKWDDLHNLSIQSPDVVIHLAGKAHDTNNASNPETYFEINYELTKDIYKLFLKWESKVFIFFSSVKASADTVIGDALDELKKPDPKTPYGASKLAAERYLLDQSKSINSIVYILRPAMIHGPGNKGNLNLLYNFTKRGFTYPLGSFNNLRSFTSIDNIIHILDRLYLGEIPSGVYNICDDEPISTNSIIEMMYKSVQKKVRIINVPKSIIILIAKLGDILGLPLDSERLKKITESYIVSNKKIKSVLNLTVLPMSSRDGMLKTIKHFSTDNRIKDQ